MAYNVALGPERPRMPGPRKVGRLSFWIIRTKAAGRERRYVHPGEQRKDGNCATQRRIYEVVFRYFAFLFSVSHFGQNRKKGKKAHYDSSMMQYDFVQNKTYDMLRFDLFPCFRLEPSSRPVLLYESVGKNTAVHGCCRRGCKVSLVQRYRQPQYDTRRRKGRVPCSCPPSERWRRVGLVPDVSQRSQYFGDKAATTSLWATLSNVYPHVNMNNMTLKRTFSSSEGRFQKPIVSHRDYKQTANPEQRGDHPNYKDKPPHGARRAQVTRCRHRATSIWPGRYSAASTD